MAANSDETIHLEHLSLDPSATGSDPAAMAPDHHRALTPLTLVLNRHVDTCADYTPIFDKLQLKGDFRAEFLDIMKDYRAQPAVREALADPANDLKEISEDFLKTYGKNIWMLRGANNKQDAKYRETFFKWKDDEDRLWSLLDELWTRVRQLLWDRASARTVSKPASPSLRPRQQRSTTSSMDAEEEAVAVGFINKVRVDIHHLPGNIRPRKHLLTSIEMD